MRSPDAAINGAVKKMADARGRDMQRNDGYTQGAVTTHKDAIVGSQYRLNAQPDWKVLGAKEGWAEEFQQVTESRFNLIADAPAGYFDAAGRLTFTDLIRMGVGGFCVTGEVLATAEWIKDRRRPFSTAIQMVAPDRLCNPNGINDSRFLRGGVKKDANGRPLSYFIRKGYPGEMYDGLSEQWAEVPATKAWGRMQVIHILEAMYPDQTRGIADMVAVLKQMKMTKSFQEITLQNAVINASFAAAIESELPPDVVYQTLGGANGGPKSYTDALGAYMELASQYYGNSNNIQLDGAKIPHLLPGSKLNMQPMATPGGVGTNFEESLLRNIAAALGLSYEEFSKDYSKTSYSSARASMNNTWRFMQSRKKIVADRFATAIYLLWLEEEIFAGNIPLPRNRKPVDFLDPMMRAAYANCSWIGASRGQIDELKETQAAILRIKAGLSTYEAEIGRMGEDWRKVFEQRAREEGIIKSKGLAFALDATKEGKNDAKNTMTDNQDQTTEEQAA